MITVIDEKEVQDWEKESTSVEEWNDVTKLKLFLRARNIVPMLWHEIQVLREQLKIRNEK